MGMLPQHYGNSQWLIAEFLSELHDGKTNGEFSTLAIPGIDLLIRT